MIESKIILGALEALLDRPAQAGGGCKFGEGGCRRGEGEEVGFLGGGRAFAADEQPALEALL